MDVKKFERVFGSSYDRLPEYHSADAEGFLELVDSILRLVFVQLYATFGLIDELLSLCKIAVSIVCFLLNNFCDIVQDRGDPLTSTTRLMVFAGQAACLCAITHYGITSVFCPILSAVLEVTENCLSVFGR